MFYLFEDFCFSSLVMIPKVSEEEEPQDSGRRSRLKRSDTQNGEAGTVGNDVRDTLQVLGRKEAGCHTEGQPELSAAGSVRRLQSLFCDFLATPACDFQMCSGWD